MSKNDNQTQNMEHVRDLKETLKERSAMLNKIENNKDSITESIGQCMEKRFANTRTHKHQAFFEVLHAQQDDSFHVRGLLDGQDLLEKYGKVTECGSFKLSKDEYKEFGADAANKMYEMAVESVKRDIRSTEKVIEELLDKYQLRDMMLQPEETVSSVAKDNNVLEKSEGYIMNKELQDQIQDLMDSYGYSMNAYDNYLEFDGYSSLGENVIVSIDITDVNSMKDFADKLKEYAENEDYDQVLKAQMGIHPSLWEAASVEEVNDCASEIGEALAQLYFRLQPVDKTNGELHGLETVFENIENAEFNYDISEGHYDITIGDGVCPLRFGGTFPGGDEQAVVDFIVSDIKSHYEDFDYNDYTREYFGVTERDAVNGLPSNIGAIIGDKNAQKQELMDIAEEAAQADAEKEAPEKRYESLRNRLAESKDFDEKAALAREIKSVWDEMKLDNHEKDKSRSDRDEL